MTTTVRDGQPTMKSEDAPRKAVVALLRSDEAKRAILPMIPPMPGFGPNDKEAAYERVIREFLNAAGDNPGILDCEPGSIIRAISRAVSWDLEIGVTAFLVPRKDRNDDPQAKLRAQIGYRGKLELMSSPRGPARYGVDALVVYKNEHFRYEQGTSPFIEHRPMYDLEKRGPIVAGYAIARLSMYHNKIVVMSVEEVREIQQKFSQQWRNKPLESIPWYVEARCVHRLSRQVPLSGKTRLIMAESADAEEEADVIEEPAPRALGAGAAEHVRTTAGERAAAEVDR